MHNIKQLEQMYTRLKRDYDCLLEKNQNDLVKIRAREKALNEKIAEIQRQRQEQVLGLTLQVARLKAQVGKHLQSAFSKADQPSKRQVTTHKEKNSLISQKYQELEGKNHSLNELNTELKRMLKESQNLSEQRFIMVKKSSQNEKELLLRLNLLNSQNESLKQQLLQIRARLLTVKQESEGNKARLEQEISFQNTKVNSLQAQNEQLRQKLVQRQKPCEKCNQLQQQLQLHRQMLKSVRMMLKFKQMELQNTKK